MSQQSGDGVPYFYVGTAKPPVAIARKLTPQGDEYYAMLHGVDTSVKVLVTPSETRTVKGHAQLHCTFVSGKHRGHVVMASARIVVRIQPKRKIGAAERRRKSARQGRYLAKQAKERQLPGKSFAQGSDRTERHETAVGEQSSTDVKCHRCGTDVKAYGSQTVAYCGDCKSE